jgi:hypothetical protein
MEQKRSRKRRWVVLAVFLLVAAAAVGGYAYFTAFGSGSGDATVGTASNIDLTSDSVSGLFPGGADVPVTVHVSNPGSGHQFVNVISGTVEDNGGCLGSWFQVDPKTFATDVAPGTAPTTTTNVRMLNPNANQNACQGKKMTIDWSSN